MTLHRLRLRKSSKLRCRMEFERLKSASFHRAGVFFAISVEPGTGQFPKCGVICSRRFSLLSVERNRARRLLWESFRLIGDRIAPCMMVLIPRRRIKQAIQVQVQQELEKMLDLAGVLKENAVPDAAAASPHV